MTTEEKNKLIAEFMGWTNLKEARPDLIKVDCWQIGVLNRDWPFTPYSPQRLMDSDYAVVDDLFFNASG